jgi:hypothetical protein
VRNEAVDGSIEHRNDADRLRQADKPGRTNSGKAHLDGDCQCEYRDDRKQQIPQRMGEVQPAGVLVILAHRLAQRRNTLAQLAGDDARQQHCNDNGADLRIELRRCSPLNECIEQRLAVGLEFIYR